MNPTRQRKLMFILILIVLLGLASALVLYALRQNLNLFYTPTQIAQGEAPSHRTLRVGGIVVKGSLLRGEGLSVRFQITDRHQTLNVFYQGILPDLFREGQGIIAQGKMTPDRGFQAVEVLAKHDENYMPPEIRDTLHDCNTSGFENRKYHDC
jgi:cytochrome c-type biogenesis protein CcmE